MSEEGEKCFWCGSQMHCPRCGALMHKEYLFTRFADEADYYHYVCNQCGYEDRVLYDSEEREERRKILCELLEEEGGDVR